MKSKRTTGCFNGDGKHPPKISMADVISSRCMKKDTSEPLKEDWRKEFESEIVDYFWNKKTTVGTQRLSSNHIEKIKDFISKVEKSAYERGKEEHLANTYKSSKVYLMGYNEAKQETINQIKEFIENIKWDGRLSQLQMLEAIKEKLDNLTS